MNGWIGPRGASAHVCDIPRKFSAMLRIPDCHSSNPGVKLNDPWGQVLLALCPTEVQMATPDRSPHRDAVFEPDERHAIALAFDEICREMKLPESATVAREIVAMRVI